MAKTPKAYPDKSSKKISTKGKKQEHFVIPMKALAGIAPAIAITAVLFSKDKAPEVLLFGIGIFCGVLIGRGYFGK